MSQMHSLLEMHEKVDGPIIYKDTVYYMLLAIQTNGGATYNEQGNVPKTPVVLVSNIVVWLFCPKILTVSARAENDVVLLDRESSSQTWPRSTFTTYFFLFF